MKGTIYVINWKTKALHKNTTVTLNGLHLSEQAYTRASHSFASEKVYAHPIKELICVGKE
ncbi:hypothetical protein N8491_02160 [Akkermansiaceae bacterium]|nr:hypothetical protein [Akkermansiaceae bacterium]MDA7896859.1 hypothetical protein [Akkermansiaceae bacterium]MDB4404964.1 hypothetical protein [bacterium]MDB4713866.1 hypothetical protein [Akkermansiaceae bacterium]